MSEIERARDTYRAADHQFALAKHAGKLTEEHWNERERAIAAYEAALRAHPKQAPAVAEWPEFELRGSKRTNLILVANDPDWWTSYGKGKSNPLEGTWWDLICLARNILASENTRLVAPEFHRPEWRNDNYTGPVPYRSGEPE